MILFKVNYLNSGVILSQIKVTYNTSGNKDPN